MSHATGRESIRTEGGVLGADTDNKHVEGNLGVRDIALDFRVVADVDDALLVVDLGRLGFVELDVGFLHAKDVADGLHDRAVFNQTGGTRGQQGGEKEVVAG